MAKRKWKFSVGDPVVKTGGDYQASGAIVARFMNHKGAPRYVVEHRADVAGCFYHVFSEGQLALEIRRHA